MVGMWKAARIALASMMPRVLAPLGHDPLDDEAGTVHVRPLLVGHGPGGLHEQALIAQVLGEEGEGLHCASGVSKWGTRASANRVWASATRVAPIQQASTGFALFLAMSMTRWATAVGSTGGQRCEDGQDPIHLRVRQAGLQGDAVAAPWGIADDVHRVAV